jgi:predicted Na+-dependent transporter
LPAVLAAVVTLAAEEGGPSHLPFYVTGAVLAAWAVLVAAFGIMRPDTFPSSSGGRAAVIGLTLLLMGATMVTAVVTAS